MPVLLTACVLTENKQWPVPVYCIFISGTFTVISSETKCHMIISPCHLSLRWVNARQRVGAGCDIRSLYASEITTELAALYGFYSDTFSSHTIFKTQNTRM